MKTKLIFAAVAATFAFAGAASAADVSIYGRVDAGLKYTHINHGTDTLEMNAGGRSHNRFGFNIVEDLGNGWKVKGYLENGFTIDDGSLDTEGQLFNRRSILAVAGPYGELGMGRAGTVQSTMAPYTMGLIKYDPFGTSYGNASIGSTFANSSRVNNGVHYISPKFAGVNFGASYSFGDKTDEAEWQDKQHTFAAAVNYTSDDLYLSLSFANVDSAHGASRVDDARTYDLGGWWRVTPDFRLFAGVGYQESWASGAKLSASKVVSDKAISKGGFDGTSGLLGMDWKGGAHKVMFDVQYFDGELANNKDVDFQRTVVAGAYEYYFSKKVIGYVAATFSTTSGKAKDMAQSVSNNDTTEVFVGLNYNF